MNNEKNKHNPNEIMIIIICIILGVVIGGIIGRDEDNIYQYLVGGGIVGILVGVLLMKIVDISTDSKDKK